MLFFTFQGSVLLSVWTGVGILEQGRTFDHAVYEGPFVYKTVEALTIAKDHRLRLTLPG